MKWEYATARDLRQMLERGCNLAILPIGSIEYHGDHLAAGIDSVFPYELAARAAEIEEAIVLPPVYYAFEEVQKMHMGTIGIKPEVLLPYLENLCNEIARNGFTKIMLLNGHGGNCVIMSALTHWILSNQGDYTVYMVNHPWFFIQNHIDAIRETDYIGHACEIETSLALALDARLVKKEWIRPAVRHNEDTRGLAPVETFGELDYHINYPQGYTGDAGKATAEKGDYLLKAGVENMVEYMRRIKADTVTEAFLARFRNRTLKPWIEE